jgi:outer membrane protein assembly factor BamB
LIALAIAAVALGSGCDDWTAYLFSSSSTGFNGGETTITRSTAGSLVSLWTTSTGGAVISGQPVTSNGFVYWGAWDGIFRATRPRDGSLAWSANLGQTPTPPACSGRTHGVLGTATVATESIGGNQTSVVYVVGGSNTIYALNATTGAQIWKRQYAQSPTETWDSPVVYNGAVYIGTASWGDCPLTQGQVFRFDAAAGTVLNTFNIVPNGCTGSGLSGSITVDANTNTLYFATGNPGSCGSTETLGEAVVKLNASNLSFVSSWQVPPAQQTSDGDFVDTPTLFSATINGTAHTLVGVANKNGIYYALDEANIGAGPVWQDPIAVGGDSPQSGLGSISPSAWDGTTLYVAGGGTTIAGVGCKGGLRAVNPANGSYLWQDCLTDGPVLAPVSASPGIVAIAEGNALELINSSNGQVLFKAADTSSSQYYGGASIANGVVYIGTQSGNLHAYGVPAPPPPPGTTLAKDTFHRPNQSLWGTASDAHVWGAEANTSALFSINNNAGQVANGSGPHSAVLGPTATNAEVLFAGSVNTFSGANMGAVLRFTDTNNWYKAYIEGANLVVQKKVAGTTTTIATTPFAATAGTSYSLRFRVVGTTITAKVWATSTAEPANWTITSSDSSLSRGNTGLRMQLGTGVTVTYTSFFATYQ